MTAFAAAKEGDTWLDSSYPASFLILLQLISQFKAFLVKWSQSCSKAIVEKRIEREWTEYRRYGEENREREWRIEEWSRE